MKKRRILSKLIYDPENKIIQKSTKDRIYRGCEILHEGIYCDSLSKENTYYPKETLKKCITKWRDNHLNINHNTMDILSKIGFVENSRWENNCVMADLRILPITQNARDTISLIDAGICTDLSVEIFCDEEYDYDTNMINVVDMEFDGVSCVIQGADPNARINF